MSVVAFKNGKKRVFSDPSWKLLGNNKEGWVAHAETTVTNVQKLPLPASGEKKVIEQTVVNVQEIPTAVTVTNENDKQKFINSAEGLKAAEIKDYFDSNDVPYKANTSKPALIELLGESLKWDVVELQKKFFA